MKFDKNERWYVTDGLLILLRKLDIVKVRLNHIDVEPFLDRMYDSWRRKELENPSGWIRKKLTPRL